MSPDEAFRTCIAAFQANRLIEAEGLANELVAAHPDNPRFHHLLGVVIARAGRVEPASRLFIQALRLLRDTDPAAAAVLHDLGIAQHRLGQPARALASLDRAVDLAPGFSEAWNTRGAILLDLGRLEDARVSLETALRHRPDFPDALANLGDVQRLTGRDLDAMASYDQALAARPNLVRAINGRGFLLNAAARHHEALLAHERAIQLAPESPEAHNGRGAALGWLGRLPEAMASFARALALRPSYVDALLNNAHALRAAEREDEALDLYRRVLAVDPALVEALRVATLLLVERERYQEALALYDKALAMKPELPELLIGKGGVLVKMGQHQEALAFYDRALELAPDAPRVRQSRDGVRDMVRQSGLSADAHFLRGNTLMLLERVNEAVAAYDQALTLDPGNFEVYNNRGIALQELTEYQEALDSFDKALALKPRSPDALAHRRSALRLLGRPEEALASARQALAIDPENRFAHSILGHTLRILGRLDEAILHFRRAVALTPAEDVHRFNLATCLLLAGQYEEGWAEYEFRWSLKELRKTLELPRGPLWLGKEDLAGKTILLHGEQGHGDTIQFCRYIPDVAARGATIVVGVSPALRELVANMPGVRHVIGHRDDLPEHDYYCPLMSLPHAFGTRLDTIPCSVPYLSAPAGRVEHWRKRLGPRQGPRIGIALSGNPDHKHDHSRSVPLELFEPVLSLAPRFYCLQKELRPRDVPAFALFPNIEFFGSELRDFSDTAAMLEEMDLVISVDTAILHLAGALGRPAWGMLQFSPDFRWLLNRSDSPWYPSVRLYRQAALDDWSAVVTAVGSDLRDYLRGRGLISIQS